MSDKLKIKNYSNNKGKLLVKLKQSSIQDHVMDNFKIFATCNKKKMTCEL